MKTIKDKYLLVGADFAGYPLKEAVVAHLKAKGWKITDVGVQADRPSRVGCRGPRSESPKSTARASISWRSMMDVKSYFMLFFLFSYL